MLYLVLLFNNRAGNNAMWQEFGMDQVIGLGVNYQIVRYPFYILSFPYL